MLYIHVSNVLLDLGVLKKQREQRRRRRRPPRNSKISILSVHTLAVPRTHHLISTVCTNHRIIKDTLVFVCVYFGWDFSAGVNTIITFANRAVSLFFFLEIHVDLIYRVKVRRRRQRRYTT